MAAGAQYYARPSASLNLGEDKILARLVTSFARGKTRSSRDFAEVPVAAINSVIVSAAITAAVIRQRQFVDNVSPERQPRQPGNGGCLYHLIAHEQTPSVLGVSATEKRSAPFCFEPT